jgi:hypothetical protein
MANSSDALTFGVAEAAPTAITGARTSCDDLQKRFGAFGVGGLDEGDTLALVLARCMAPGVDTVKARLFRAEGDTGGAPARGRTPRDPGERRAAIAPAPLATRPLVWAASVASRRVG